jgi:hypothetical protein
LRPILVGLEREFLISVSSVSRADLTSFHHDRVLETDRSDESKTKNRNEMKHILHDTSKISSDVITDIENGNTMRKRSAKQVTTTVWVSLNE